MKKRKDHYQTEKEEKENDAGLPVARCRPLYPVICGIIIHRYPRDRGYCQEDMSMPGVVEVTK